MKKSLSQSCTLSALAAVAWLACQALPAQNTPNPQAQVRQLQELVRQQGERLAAMEALLAKQQQSVASLAKAQQATPAAQSGSTEVVVPKVSLRKGIDQLKIVGDLRLRYEHQNRDVGGVESSRDRFMPRLRLGLVWTASDWEMGAGLATGGSGATSTNDTWNSTNPFQTDDIRLDYAYAKRQWCDFTLTLGQQKNPFVSTWAIWDGDVRPTGVTGQYNHGPWFATLGGYNVRHYGRDEDNAYLGAGQVGAKGTRGNLSGKAALSLYHYNNATVDPNDTTNQPAPAIATDDYTFSMGSLYAEASYKGEGWKSTLYGEYTRNFAADGTISQVAGMPAGSGPDDNDTAWVLGAKVGISDFGIGYAYAHIEADSVYGRVNDGTIGAAFTSTDIEGHVIVLSYAPTKRLKLSAQAFLVEPIERSDRGDGELFLVDATWKF